MVEPPEAGSVHWIWIEALLAVVTVGASGLAGTVAAIIEADCEYYPGPISLMALTANW